MNSRAILGLAGLSLVGAVIAGYWGFTPEPATGCRTWLHRPGSLHRQPPLPAACTHRKKTPANPSLCCSMTSRRSCKSRRRRPWKNPHRPCRRLTRLDQAIGRTPRAACVPEPGSVTKASKPAANWRGSKSVKPNIVVLEPARPRRLS